MGKKDFKQNVVTKRFLDIFNYLKSEKHIKSYSDCGKKIDYPRESLSEIGRGIRNIPMNALYNFILEYKVDPRIIFSRNDTYSMLEKEALDKQFEASEAYLKVRSEINYVKEGIVKMEAAIDVLAGGNSGD